MADPQVRRNPLMLMEFCRRQWPSARAPVEPGAPSVYNGVTMSRASRLVAFLLVFVGGFAWSLPGRICLCSLTGSVFGAGAVFGAPVAGDSLPSPCCVKACCGTPVAPNPGPKVDGAVPAGDCCLHFDRAPDRPEVKTIVSTVPMVDLDAPSAAFVPVAAVRTTAGTVALPPPSRAAPEFRLPLRI